MPSRRKTSTGPPATVQLCMGNNGVAAVRRDRGRRSCRVCSATDLQKRSDARTQSREVHTAAWLSIDRGGVVLPMPYKYQARTRFVCASVQWIQSRRGLVWLGATMSNPNTSLTYPRSHHHHNHSIQGDRSNKATAPADLDRRSTAHRHATTSAAAAAAAAPGSAGAGAAPRAAAGGRIPSRPARAALPAAPPFFECRRRCWC